MAKATSDDVLFFRLRIPRPLGDAIADMAWRNRRSANAQTILLLEQAMGWETEEDAMAPAPGGKGARAAGTGRATPMTRAEAEGLAEKRRRYDEAEAEHRREMAEIPDPPDDYPPPPENVADLFKPITQEEMVAMRQTAARMLEAVEAFKGITSAAAPETKSSAKKPAAKAAKAPVKTTPAKKPTTKRR